MTRLLMSCQLSSRDVECCLSVCVCVCVHSHRVDNAVVASFACSYCSGVFTELCQYFLLFLSYFQLFCCKSDDEVFYLVCQCHSVYVCAYLCQYVYVCQYVHQVQRDSPGLSLLACISAWVSVSVCLQVQHDSAAFQRHWAAQVLPPSRLAFNHPASYCVSVCQHVCLLCP